VSFCKSCGRPIEWAWEREAARYHPVEPVATHGPLDRTFVDENGVLRAEHSCRTSIGVTRLDKKVPAGEAGS
jgi:hypothetical protein